MRSLRERANLNLRLASIIPQDAVIAGLRVLRVERAQSFAAKQCARNRPKTMDVGRQKPSVSRRDFFGLRWGRGPGMDSTRAGDAARSDDPHDSVARAEGSGSPALGSVYLGTMPELLLLPIGAARRPPSGIGGVFVVRAPEGLLALSAQCPHDGQAVTWRATERSEDTLAELGRFYCRRDASIFNRLGILVAGPAPRSLSTLPIVAQGGALVADGRQPQLRSATSGSNETVFYALSEQA